MRQLVVFCFLFISCTSQVIEGDQCNKGGVAGVCKLMGQCPSAIEGLKKRIRPQICGFQNTDIIICCIEDKPPTTVMTSAPSTTIMTTAPPGTSSNQFSQARPITPEGTTSRPPVATTTRPTQTTTEYNPPEYEYVSNVERREGCAPLDANITSAKTGQKAWDKCVEYQEKYVYPCERSVALIGSMTRVNHCHHNADQLIVGGVSTDPNEFPHMVLLGYGDLDKVQWACGGAIISDWFILTAGHCISSRDLGAITHAASTFRRNDIDPARIYKIKRIIKHPDYKPPAKYHDIALLETEAQIKLDQYVNPGCLYVGDSIDDSQALATGWGLTQYKGTNSEVMQKVILNKFTDQECSSKHPRNRLMRNGLNSTTQMCYGDKTQSKDTCQGDSGGPLQVKNKKIHCMYTIIGVTSFGKGCGFVGEPGVYTKVDAYLPWIEEIVWP